MSVDKYPSKFSHQIETLAYISSNTGENAMFQLPDSFKIYHITLILPGQVLICLLALHSRPWGRGPGIIGKKKGGGREEGAPSP